MGAKQKSKTKLQQESKRTKVRRAEELRALFNSASENAEPEKADKTIATENRTLTPTPTELTASRRSPLALSDQTNTSTRTATAVRLSNRPQETTSLRTVVSSQPYSPARRLDTPIRPQVVEEESHESSRWLGPLLLLAALFMGFLGYWNIERSSALRAAKSVSADTKRAVNSEDRSRIEFYRQQMGHRLNRQRVDVEIENVVRSPTLGPADAPLADRAMMYGAPLMPEGYYKTSSRDRLTPVHPDHPDARIQYGLQEEQDRDQFQQLADKAYAQDFISNARANGFDVTLDEDYNVIDVKKSSGETMRAPGSAPGLAK